MKHGGDLTAAMAHHGGEREDWLDLSTGINPHAYPLPHLDRRLWTDLPAIQVLQDFLDAARAAYAVPEAAEVVAAPGTQALIQWLPRLLPPGRSPLSDRPTTSTGSAGDELDMQSSTSRRQRWRMAFPREAAIS